MALLDVVDTPIQGKWQVIHLKNKKLSPTLKAFKHFLLEQGGALIDAWS